LTKLHNDELRQLKLPI